MFFEAGRELLLPHGLIDAEGERHRVAVLRPLSGREEAMLAAGAGSSGLLSRLLCACLARIGGYEAPSLEHVAALTRGDRQRLALWVRADLFGERLSLVLSCPNPACRQRADLDLEIPSIAPELQELAPEQIVVETADGTATLREPTGADDDLLAREAGDGAGGPEQRRRRAALLWSRLLLDLGGRGPVSAQAWLALAPATRQAVALGLAEQSSAPDLAFYSHCPGCAATIEVEIDPVRLLQQELRLGSDRLMAEIHCLAWHYGWSETDIIALPRARRWRYIELLRRQIEGRPLTTWS
jgi:hypothetical protein